MSVTFAGNPDGVLYKRLQQLGVDFRTGSDLLIIEAGTAGEQQLEMAERIRRNGGLIWIMLAEKTENPVLDALIPAKWDLTDRKATALETGEITEWGKYFDLSQLYFAEMDSDKQIIKCGLAGEIVEKGETVFKASRTDWSLFNQQPENKKCAQVVLYEALEKPSGAALVKMTLDRATWVVSTLDYRIRNETTEKFWKSLLTAMQIRLTDKTIENDDNSRKNHNLLLDGPVD
jgi:beta-galactosidase